MEAPQKCTNEELYLIIQSNHAETMREVSFIKEQTTKTNGCVNKLKDEMIDIKLWRANVQGKTWILPIVISAIISGVVGFLFLHMK